MLKLQKPIYTLLALIWPALIGQIFESWPNKGWTINYG